MNTTLHFKCHTIIGCECELFEISMVSFIMDVQIYQCAILYSMSWCALNSNRFPAGDLMCPSNCIHNKYQNKSINQCALQWENFATFLSPQFIYLPLCLLLFLRPRAIAHSHTPQATSRLCARGRKKISKQTNQAKVFWSSAIGAFVCKQMVCWWSWIFIGHDNSGFMCCISMDLVFFCFFYVCSYSKNWMHSYQ